MKITVDQLIKARDALSRMSIKSEVSFVDVRRLYILKNVVSSEINLTGKAQNDLVNLCEGSIDDDGKIIFTTRSQRQRFEQLWGETLQSEIDIDIEPLDFSKYEPFVTFEGSNIDIDALSNLVAFYTT